MGTEATREDAQHAKVRRAEPSGLAGPAPAPEPRSHLSSLHQRIGNRAVQRLLAQRSANEPMPVDDDLAARINSERGGGQPLDSAVQAQAGKALGYDMGHVRVHTSAEADALTHSLSAQAFTTGSDIFFRSGAYDPHTDAGRNLIHHELTHVVQQGAGNVSGNTAGMVVNPPGDAFEREADAVASSLAQGATAQRQAEPEEEEPIQARFVALRQMAPEQQEELAQTKPLQRQAGTEEEELQRQIVPDEDIKAGFESQKPRSEEDEDPVQHK
ncbi:MAG: eCIS core domain-containing protein [Anaerolineae bacterium]